MIPWFYVVFLEKLCKTYATGYATFHELQPASKSVCLTVTGFHS